MPTIVQQFSVNRQEITLSNELTIAADCRNYLRAAFRFQGWDNSSKTAVFYSWGEDAYHVLLDGGNTCLVPHEVIKAPGFYVAVFGGDLMTTNKVMVKVISSGYRAGVAPPVPTPDIYAQLTATVQEEKEQAGLASGVAVQAANEAASHRDFVEAAHESILTISNTVAVQASAAIEAKDAAKGYRDESAAAQQGATAAYNGTMEAIGADICPLVGGMIPVSKIPMSVVHTVVEINTEAELINLTREQVQLNDIACIVQGSGTEKLVVSSYQLLGTGDPSLRENWVIMGTSHASTSAHARQADNSLSAEGLKGYPLIITKKTEYAQLSEKPKGVLYIVFPDNAF